MPATLWALYKVQFQENNKNFPLTNILLPSRSLRANESCHLNIERIKKQKTGENMAVYTINVVQ